MTVFTITGGALLDAATWAGRVIPSRPTAPVLAGLLLDAADQLTVTGYDLETRASATVPCTTTEPGRILLSGRLLAAVAKTVGRGADVVIEQEQDGPATVRAGRAEWSLPVLPVADYPELPDLSEPVGAVRGDLLREALGRVVPATSKEVSLPMLTGVRIESEGDQLTLVATDRFRLAAATIPWQPADDRAVEGLVPGALLDTAARGAGEGLVSVLADDRGFGLATDDRLVAGRQIDAEYLQYRRFLGLAGEHRAVVEVEELRQAVDQALVAADHGASDLPAVLLAFDGDEVRVSAAGKAGRARAGAGALLDGEPITVKVQAPYLRDALSSHGCDKVAICFAGGPNKPITLLGDDPGYSHVLMPCRMASGEGEAA